MEKEFHKLNSKDEFSQKNNLLKVLMMTIISLQKRKLPEIKFFLGNDSSNEVISLN